MNPEIDLYLNEGCGRCPLGGTPDCKIHRWREEMPLLRQIVLDCGLREERKWGVACYTYHNKNILMLAAFKDFCFLSFFKGALLEDSHQILEKGGEHTQSGRLVRINNTAQIMELESVLKAYIFEAVEVEKAGLKVEFKKVDEYEVPPELEQKMKELPELRAAFEALTPGRQKGYLLHFAAAKQAKTRLARIEKYLPLIMQGKGLHDDYKR